MAEPMGDWFTLGFLGTLKIHQFLERGFLERGLRRANVYVCMYVYIYV